MRDLPKTKRSVRELIRAGAFEKAIALATTATGYAPSDGELKYLLAAALFDRSVQLDNTFIDANARSYGTRAILKTIKEHEPDFADSIGLVAQIASREDRGLAAAIDGAKQARELREKARTALSQAPEGHAQTALLKAWLAAYEIVLQEDLRYFNTVAKGLKVPNPEGVSPSEPPPDARALRKSSLIALAELAKKEPTSPGPYLAAAEWFAFTGVKDSGHAAILDRERRVRYQEGLIRPDSPPFPTAAAEELARVRGLALPEFSDLKSSNIVPLLERAKALDIRREFAIGYFLYLQICPIDREQRQALLDDNFGDKQLASLAAMERARLVCSEEANPTAMLAHLERARRSGNFSRPLFTTIPPEVRGTLLSARGVWRSLWLNGFPYRGLLLGLSRVTDGTAALDEKVKLLLLKASVCELLTYSELPQDWMLGASKQAECLDAILRTRGIPDDLRARTALAADRLRAAVAIRPAPVSMVALFDGRVDFTTAAEAGGPLTNPCVVVDLATGTISWAPKVMNDRE